MVTKLTIPGTVCGSALSLKEDDVLVFFDTLLIKGCIFEGWPGWLYVLQRTLAEIMIAIEIIDRRLRPVSR
jgi:hypothetical protein